MSAIPMPTHATQTLLAPTTLTVPSLALATLTFLELSLVVHNEVCWISLKTLSERVVSDSVGFQPFGVLHVVSERILGGQQATTTTSRFWNKEVGETSGHGSSWKTGGSNKKQVHDVTPIHIWDVASRGS